MTKYDIINEIANNNTVEKIIYKLIPNSKNRFDCPDDLVQDIYEILLKKDDSLIDDLYNKGELGYYILKIAENQIFSCNSRYYYTYIKLGVQSDDISEASHIITDDTE